MKIVHVSAAAIVKDNKLLLTERGGKYSGYWEFPGGKIEEGETFNECIIREIREELSLPITPLKHLGTIEYDYPDFHLTMELILSHMDSDYFSLNEHLGYKWVDSTNITKLKLLEADRKAIPLVRKYIK